MREKEILANMLQVEQNACRILEKAKDEANRLLVHARMEAQHALESTKRDLYQERETLHEQLRNEAEHEVEIINEEKKRIQDEIKMRAHLKRDEAIKQAKKYFFDNFWENL